ncbi:class I SAM-dependent methyltransferase [Corynebacterium sp. CNCTC7651]|uniref:class I SAM-dependent methyltransferase n=1 Tax=Corynebacterium sp. CNCTC7651 TaxID=2815361 RepID=UPI001F2228D1|nr:class I SAM-dependent methyltransferase [Corynebacterium sp. CNCTC7651]
MSERVEPVHLAAIDASAWPGVAKLPQITGAGTRSRLAEAGFARAVSRAGLLLDGPQPDLVVDHADVFTRIAASGWIGLAEGYLAGEWHTASSESLVHVLEGLVRAKYAPRTTKLAPSSADALGEVPPSLVSHYSGDGVSPFQGHFATGVPTTERKAFKSRVPGAGKGREPARHYVAVTEFGAPLDTSRLDLADAQARSTSMLLDAAHVTRGSHTLVVPTAGGAIAVEAASRRANVDCVAAQPATAEALREHLVFAGAEDAVHVLTGQWGLAPSRPTYDAIVSAEYLETLAPREKIRYLRAVDSALMPGGRAAAQTVVRTERMSRAGTAALSSLRAYIWPGLHFATIKDIATMLDQHTGLRLTGVTLAPDHLAASLKLQRATFDTRLRDAAADGFDVVYRRLWTWQLALREALARLGMLDLAQVVATTRSRGGRR